jgi:hypothetical protein
VVFLRKNVNAHSFFVVFSMENNHCIFHFSWAQKFQVSKGRIRKIIKSKNMSICLILTYLINILKAESDDLSKMHQII